jgi:hypothetical protein
MFAFRRGASTEDGRRVIDSPSWPVVSLVIVILTHTWLFSFASAHRGHTRPRVSR